MKSPLKSGIKSNLFRPLDFSRGSRFGGKNIQAKFNPSQFKTQHKGGS